MYFKEKRSWEIPPTPVSESSILTTETADVVVIGAGHAGVLAARAALEQGASVILVETMNEQYLNVFGHDVGVINSQIAHDRGVPHWDPIDVMQEYQRRSLNRCNTDLIRIYANESGECFDWFIDALDPGYKEHLTIEFQNPPKYYEWEYHGYKTFVGTMKFPHEREWGLPQAIKDTIKNFKEAGGKAYFMTQAEYLEKHDGRVTGVICLDRKTKEHLRLNARKGVILAAGDFAGNREMVNDLLDEFAELSRNGEKYPDMPYLGRDGSGIRMGIWAGGHIQEGYRGGMYTSACGQAGMMGAAPFLKLNVNGKRYTNEGLMGHFGAGYRAIRQPGGFIFTVWDDNWPEQLQYMPTEHIMPDINGPRGEAYMREVFSKLLEEKKDEITGDAAQKAAEFAKVVKDQALLYGPDWKPSKRMPGPQCETFAAYTLEDLADKLGFEGESKENFLHSIKRYNELCRLGRDEDYAKDARLMHPIEKAPFYGVRTVKDAQGVFVSEAGLVVDGNQQVLDDELAPIPGLFASGNCAGEVFPMSYFTPISGSSIGTCQTLGRAVGRYVASL